MCFDLLDYPRDIRAHPMASATGDAKGFVQVVGHGLSVTPTQMIGFGLLARFDSAAPPAFDVLIGFSLLAAGPSDLLPDLRVGSLEEEEAEVGRFVGTIA